MGWIYGLENFVRDLEFMISGRIGWWWKVSWKIITPVILTVKFRCFLAVCVIVDSCSSYSSPR